MNDIKSSHNYHYEHSVNVAVLSLIIGTEPGLTTRELEALAFGDLLIDVGCQWLDDDF